MGSTAERNTHRRRQMATVYNNIIITGVERESGLHTKRFVGQDSARDCPPNFPLPNSYVLKDPVNNRTFR